MLFLIECDTLSPVPTTVDDELNVAGPLNVAVFVHSIELGAHIASITTLPLKLTLRILSV